jgi:hypothetical protein
MGFLDSSSSIVTAILTRKGRELIAKNDGSFRIVKFAFGDDEINYQLYNIATQNDTDILNLPVLEPSSNENTALRYRLVTMPAGSIQIAYLLVNPTTVVVSNRLVGGQTVPNQAIILVTTINGSDPSGYIATSRNTTIANVEQTNIGYDPSLPFVDPATGREFQGQGSGMIRISGGSINGTTFIDVAGKDSGGVITIPVSTIGKEGGR